MSEAGPGRPFPREAEAHLRRQAKAELRKRIAAVRRALPRDARAERSRAVAERLLALDALRAPGHVLAYWPMRGEVDPRPAFDALRARGATLALPRMDWGADALALHAHDPSVPLEESGMGFLQPPADAPRIAPAAIDAVLVPAVAADDRGYRIGLGKGFYDRLLPTLEGAFSVALLFDFQLVAEVPEEPHDARVHHVVTDRRHYAAAAGPGTG